MRGPAGHETVFAYRFACSQLQSQVNAAGKVEWFVIQADGSKYILATTEPQANALVWLDAAGICKTGGVEVPVISPEAAALVQSGRLTLTPVYLPPQTFPVAWVLVAVAALGMGAIALRRQPMPTIQGLLGGNDEN